MVTGSALIKVLVVQDERLMFEGLISLLADHPDISVAGVATSSADAVVKSVHLAPDVVLMDTRLRDSAGAQACERIRAARPDAAVLFLSAETGADTITRAAAAGAAGYLSTEVSTTELVDAIRKLAEGELLVTTSTLARELREQSGAASAGRLTSRERQVLKLLASGLSNLQIASELGIDTPAVRSHVRSVIESLGVHSKAQAVADARHAGLLDDASGAQGAIA